MCSLQLKGISSIPKLTWIHKLNCYRSPLLSINVSLYVMCLSIITYLNINQRVILHDIDTTVTIKKSHDL